MERQMEKDLYFEINDAEHLAEETNDILDWGVCHELKQREILRQPLGRNEEDWYDDD